MNLEQRLFAARVGFLLGQDQQGMERVVSVYTSPTALASDENAVRILTHLGLSAAAAESVKRWATNCIDAKKAGWREFASEEEVYRLGAPSADTMMRIGMTFPDLFVVANSLPSDLLQAMPTLSLARATHIIAAAQVLVAKGPPHIHQLIGFSQGPEGTRRIEMPPRDINADPDAGVAQVLQLLEQLGFAPAEKEEPSEDSDQKSR